ncbi:hypothetical protein B0T20DRAFT_85024 [Sordaria brevicollis]|uniref:Uncharacterized protein n=1 Tax=Sordaria brevicollis TaxID=83679 RepID=A0AAE0U5Z7_SORBR|nr:hypothetical protein B0T20DRAFT_85024 [Sordaria brevicollis]
MAAPITTSGLKYASKLSNQRVLILGGTSGIGFAVAEASLEAGLLVTISSSSTSKLSSSLDRLRSSPAYTYNSSSSSQQSIAGGGIPRLTGFTCDLSSPTTVEVSLTQLLDQATLEGRHKFDHVVFTAGDALSLTPISQITPEIYEKACAVRFTAPLILAKLLSSDRYFNHAVSSSITFTGGTNTEKPGPGWAVVAAVGGALEGLVRGLAVDLKPTRVNLVSPGAVQTELFDAFGKGEQLEQILEGFKKRTLTRTVGRPEDVAEAYMYFMRDRFVTGRVVATDGGRILV